MATQIDIANRALLSVGARTQVSSINPSDGSVEANAISVLYQPTFEALARTAQWNCLTKQKTLTLLMAAQGTPENVTGTTLPAPPVPWLYAYAYPSDCLLFRFIIPSLPVQTQNNPPNFPVNLSAATWLPSAGQIPYAVSSVGDTNNTPILMVLTNQTQANGVYNANIQNPQVWDSLFQAAMVASLGAFLVPALSLSMDLMKLNIQTAEAHITRARAMDGNEGVTTMDHTPDWILARAGGGNWGQGYNFSTFGSFVNMTWPSYGGSYGY